MAFITKVQYQPGFTWKDNDARVFNLTSRFFHPSASIGLPFIKSKNPKVYTIYRIEAQNSKKNNFTPKKIEKHLLYIDSKLDEYNHARAAADGDNKATIEKEIQKHTQRRENYIAKVFHSNPSPPHPKRGLIIEPELFNPCWCFFTNKG